MGYNLRRILRLAGILSYILLAGCVCYRWLQFQEEENVKGLPIDGWRVTVVLKHHYEGKRSPIEEGIADSLIPFAFWLEKRLLDMPPGSELLIDTMIVGGIDDNGNLQRVWINTIDNPEKKRDWLYSDEPLVIFDSIPEYAICRIYYRLVYADGRKEEGRQDYKLHLSNKKVVYGPFP